MKTIKDILNNIQIELTQANAYKKGKIEFKLEEALFKSFIKYIQFNIKYKQEELHRFTDCGKCLRFTVKVNTKTIWFSKI